MSIFQARQTPKQPTRQHKQIVLLSEGSRYFRSAKIPTMGCTKAYCSLSGLFVSGSRCLPYNRKFIFDFRGADLFYRNKKYRGIVLKRTAHDILFRIGQISVKGNKHHDRICCQKGSDVVSIKRKPGWDILSVFPIRALD